MFRPANIFATAPSIITEGCMVIQIKTLCCTKSNFTFPLGMMLITMHFRIPPASIGVLTPCPNPRNQRTAFKAEGLLLGLGATIEKEDVGAGGGRDKICTACLTLDIADLK